MLVKNNEIAKIMNHYGEKAVPFLFILDFEARQGNVLTLPEARDEGFLFQTLNFQNYPHSSPQPLDPSSHRPFLFTKSPIPYETYKLAFDKVIREIKHGNSYLLNLTFPTPINTELDLLTIFHRSKAKFKLLYPNKFVVFSPEIFVLIEKGVISSFPMKGTIDADIEDAEQKLLSDKKEEAEHNTIVDLIRNDLSMVASNIRVEKFRYIDKLETNQKTLLQLSSHICGDLPSGYEKRLGSIISSLLPAGSVSGAPKAKTVEIIHTVELDNRGYYTGTFGYFDGKKLESAVMIRFIESGPKGLIFRSGGGITSMSDCWSEYNEMTDKVYVPIV